MNFPVIFSRKDWEVADLSLPTARDLIRQYHYMRGIGQVAVYCHGLFLRELFWEVQCQGVAWWLPPMKNAAQSIYPQNWQGVLMLSRLVVLPDVPKNACSFLISQSMRFIDRRRWPCLLSYADAEFRGHTGTIYRAAGWREAGWTKPELSYVKNGRIRSRKGGQRTRTHAEMLAMGCQILGRFRRLRFVHLI